MGIGKKVEDALNKQINAEFYSALLYLQMAADFEAKNLTGFANWMEVQYGEENKHAMKLRKYILVRGGKVKLTAMEAPKPSWKSALEAFEDAYAHEKKITGMIHKLLETAKDEKDYATESMLKWFVDEQVEEEAQTLQLLEIIKGMGESKNALYMLDHRLAKRKEGQSGEFKP
ncbi:MAG: ferritin [bacterium]